MNKCVLIKCLLWIFCAFFVSASQAQSLSDYKFENTTGTYTEITGGTAVPGLSANTNAISGLITLPFPFTYLGSTYSFMKVSTAGFLVLGTSGVAGPTVNDLASGQAGQISPLWDNHTITASNITYQVTGASPNQVLTIQWKNFQWNTDTVAESNMQVKLYQNNQIEFIYGTLEPRKVNSAKPSASIGLNGDCGQAFLSITPASTPTGSTSVANNTINSKTNLASGRIYRFTPYITSLGSGSWSNPDIWSSGAIPLNTSKVIIPNGHTITIPDNYTAECQRLEIGTERNVTASTQPAIVRLSGATSTLRIQGDQYSAEALRISAIDVITLSSVNTNDYAVLDIGNGTLDLTGNLSIDGLQYSSTGTANMRCLMLISDGRATVTGNIRRSSKPCTVTGSPDISAFIKENSIVDLSGGKGTLNIAGNLESGVNLVLGTNSNTVNFNGTSAQVLRHTNFNTLKINNAAGVTCDLEVTALNITIGDENANAILNDSGRQLRGSSSGKFKIQNSGTLILGSASVATQFPLNFQPLNISLATGSTVNYRADQLQTIKALSYGNLTFSKSTGSAAKTIKFTQTHIINGNLSFINSGSGSMTFEYDLPGTNAQSIGGNLNLSGTTFLGNTGSGNITYSIGGKIIQSGAASSFTGNTGSGSVAYNVGGAYTSTGGPIIISDGQGPVIMTIGREFTYTGGSFTGMTAASGGTVTMNVTDSVIQNGNFILNESGGTATFNVIKGNFVKKYSSLLTVNNSAGDGTLDIQTGSFRTDTLGQKSANQDGKQITVSNGTGKGKMHVKGRLFKDDFKANDNSGVLVVSNSTGEGELLVDGEFHNKGGDFYGSKSGNAKIIFGRVSRDKGTNFIVNNGAGDVQMTVTGNFTNTLNNVYINKSTGTTSLTVNGTLDKKAGLLVVTDTIGKGTLTAGTITNVAGNIIGSNRDTGQAIINVTGNFTKQAGTLTINNDNATVATMTVGGNFVNTAGDVIINRLNGKASLTVNTNLNKAAGNIFVNQGAGEGSLTVLRNLTHSGGNLTGSSGAGRSSIYIGFDVDKTNGIITVSDNAGDAEFKVDGKFDNLGGDLRIVNNTGDAKLIVKGNLTRNTSSPFVIGGGAGLAELTISGSYLNVTGDLTVSSSTGQSKVNITGDVVKSAGNFVLSSSDGDVYFKVGGKFTNKAGNLTLSNHANGADTLIVAGDFMKEAGSVIVSNSSNNNVKLDVGGLFTNQTGDFTASNAKGAPVIKFGSFKLENGNFYGSTDNSSPVTGKPQISIVNSLEITGGIFYGCDDDEEDGPNELIYTIGGDLKLSGGTFIGTADVSANKFTIGGNLIISAGDFICAQRAASSPLESPVTGNPVYTIDGNINMTGGTLTMCKVPANPPMSSGGVTQLNIRGGFTVNSGTFTAVSGYTNPTSFGEYDGQIIFKNKLAGAPASNDMIRLGTSLTANQTSAYRIIIENQRTLTMQSDIELSTGKSLTVNGSLITGNFIVRNTSSGSASSGTIFTLANNGSLDIGSVDGITNSGSTGSIQTNNRTYNSGAIYKYSFAGSGTVPGNGLPGTVKGLIVNTPVLTLGQNITVDSLFTITADNQVLRMSGSNIITISNLAKVIGLGKKRFVEGGMTKVFASSAQAFTYHLGVLNGSDYFYRPFGISPSAAITANLQVNLRKTTTSTLYPVSNKEATLDGVNDNYYHELRAVTGSIDKSVAISMHYDPAEAGINNPGMITIARFKDGSAADKWRDMNAVMNATDTTLFTTPFITPDKFAPLTGVNPMALAGTDRSDNYASLAAEFYVDKQNPCVGEAIVFTSTSTGAPSTYLWEFGPTATPTTSNSPGPVTITYNSSGSKTIKLTVTKGANIKEYVMSSYMVGLTSDLTPPIQGNAESCKDDIMQYHVTAASQTDTFNWTVNNDAQIISGQNTDTVLIRFVKGGNTSITTTKTNNIVGCTATTQFKNINVRTVNMSDIIGKEAACQGGTFESYAVDDHIGSQYVWSAVNGTIVSGQNTSEVLINWTTAGIGEVRVKETLSSGSCSESDTMKVNVSTITAKASDDASVCYGQNKQLQVIASGSSQGDYTYSWTPVTNLSNPNIANPVAQNLTEAITYYVEVKDGCSAAKKDTVVLFVSPIIGTQTKDTSICKGTSVTLPLVISGGNGGPYSVSWRTASGTFSAVKNPVVSPLETTKYYATVSDGCSSPKVDSVTITVFPGITAAVPKKVVYVCTSNTAKLDVNVTGGQHIDSLKYEWTNYYTNEFVSNLKDPNVNTTATTTYKVRVYDNCSPEKFDTVRVVTGAPLTSAVSPDTTVCYNTPVALWANPVGGAGSGSYIYEWTSNPAGFSSQLQNPTPYPVENTVYYLKITDECSPEYLDSVVVTVGPPVTVSVNADTTVCEGSPVSLIATGLGGSKQLTYSWSPVTGLSDPNSSNPVATPSESINYTVTVSDECSPVATESIFLTILPKPAADAGADTNICLTDSAEIGTPLVDGLTYNWTSSPAGFTSSAAMAKVSPSETTTYYLSVTNQNGCVNIDSVVVNILAVLADAGDNKVNCSGNGITIGTAEVTGYTYNWTSNPAGFFSSEAQPTVFPSSTTVYYLTATNTDGCVKTDSTTVTIGDFPNADAGTDQVICPGASVQIGTPAIAGLLYNWTSNPASVIPAEAQPNVKPSVSTMYYLTVTNAEGCTKVDSVQINIYPAPVTEAGDNKNTCPGGSVQIGTPAIAGNSYSWTSVPAGFTSTDAELTVSPSVSTKYYLTVTSPDNCIGVDSVEVTINQLPVADAGVDKSICPGESIQIGTIAAAGDTYSWTSNPAGFTSTDAQPSVNPLTTTKYYLTVTSSAGCISMDSAEVTVNEVPVSDAGIDRSICPGSNTTLGIPAIAGNTYSWTSNPAGFTSADAEPVVSPSSETRYYLTVTNAAGCVTLDSVLVSLNPSPVADAGADATICQGSTTQLNATGGIAYSWSPSAGLNDSLIANPVASPSTTTMYYVTVRNTEGCVNTDSVLVTVNPAPVADGGTDKSICIGSTAQIGTPAIAGNTYSWTSNPAGFISADAEAVVNPSVTTTYYLNVVSLQGCTKTDSIIVTVHPIPVADAGTNTAICEGSSTQLNATGGTAYSWTPVTGLNNPLIANPTASPSVTTMYYVTVSSAGGCSNTDSVLVTVNAMPTADAGSDKLTCKESSVQIGTPPVGGNTYSWTSIPAGFTSAVAQPSVNPQVTTTYYLVVSSSSSCTKNDSVVVTVDNIDAQYSYTPAAPMANDPVNFSSSASIGALSYEWDFGDPTSGPNNTSLLANPSHIYTQPGNYNVRLIVTSVNNCKDTLIQSFNILVDGLESRITSTMNVYPNPTTGKVTLDIGSETGTWIITVRDMHGKVLHIREKYIDAQTDLDLANLSDGLYFIEMKSKQGIKFGKVQIVQ